MLPKRCLLYSTDTAATNATNPLSALTVEQRSHQRIDLIAKIMVRLAQERTSGVTSGIGGAA